MSDNNSYFYNELTYSGTKQPNWIDNLEKYSMENAQRVYLKRFPVVDFKHVEYNEHLMLLVPGYKIALIKESDSVGTFEDYCDDVKQAISYLYQKYDFLELGRYKEIANQLITTECNTSILNELNLTDLFKKITLNNAEDRRKSGLLISLCVGCPNEIDKVGVVVPISLLDKVKHKIQLFDADQTRFIYANSVNKLVKVQGLSGTGKTELLLHKLRKLYTENNDSKIFFTCHNRILADNLRQRIVEFFNHMKVSQQLSWWKRLWCAHAWGSSYEPNSGLYSYICNYYKIPFEAYGSLTTFSDVCNRALKKLEEMTDFEKCFDYIIVDESQDFDYNFTKLCQKVAHFVYMAGDVFQSIFAKQIAGGYDVDYSLSICYRTAPDTLMFAHALGLGLFEKQRYRWLENEDWIACGYKVDDTGNTITLSREPIKRFDFEGDTENYNSIIIKTTTHDMISKVVCDIIEEVKNETNDELSPDDIAIIFIDRDSSIYTLANEIEIELGTRDTIAWEVNKAYETKEKTSNKLFISNRNNVKGLEFPYVICVTAGIQNNYSYRNSIYTMLTRSFITSYLVIAQNAIPDEITMGLNDIRKNHKITVQKPSNQEIKEIKIQFDRAKIAKSLKDLIDQLVRDKSISSKNVSKIVDILKIRGIDGFDEEQVTENAVY